MIDFIVAIALGTAYVAILFRYSKSNKTFFRVLGISALIIFLVHAVDDYLVVKEIAQGNVSVFALCVIAVSHSLEIFVFNLHFFDTGYEEFYFGPGYGGGHPFHAYIYSITYVLACISSSALIIRALSRRRAGRSWLASHKKGVDNSHVFFLGGNVAEALAIDIKATHPDQLRIFVGFPDPEEIFVDLSIWEKIKRLFRSRQQEDQGPFDAIVYSRVPLSQTSGKDISLQMDLKDLDVFLKNPTCKVYLLADDEKENLHCAELLYQDGCKAEIFCRACREGVNKMYEDAMTKTPSMNVHLIDSACLAVRNIKNNPELLPVNYVDKGTDAKGFREGWVSSAFNAMILGFGETGREMLGFLYESGSFVGRNFKRSPFSCVVMDNKMDSIELLYRKSFPGMNEDAGITFRQYEIGGNDFWEDMAGRIKTLNYIVVCLGDDRRNLRLAADLVEFAYRQGRDLSKNFVILVVQKHPTHLDRVTMQYYNSIGQYHDCIREFGNLKDVWTYDNMTGDSLKARAKSFFAGYMRAQGDTRDPGQVWNQRDEMIVNTPDFALHSKLVRQRAQDFANCFHISTKMALLGPEIIDCRKDIAKCIPAHYENAHYTGDDKHVETVLHYMAVHEHIRWETSHVAMGYAPGKCTDEVKKTHQWIMSYDDLTPEVQHFDYLVIKTTFEL